MAGTTIASVYNNASNDSLGNVSLPLTDACANLLVQIGELRDPFNNRPNTRQLVILCYTTISLFGACGNLLVILAAVHNVALRSPRNYFVINLAVSDFIMCTITVPFTAYYLLDLFWELGDSLCRIVASLQGINVFVSTLSITAISLDRYLLIIFPLSNRLHRLVPLLVFGPVWFISIAMAAPMLFSTSVQYPLDNFAEPKNCTEIIGNYPMCREAFASKNLRITYTLACFAFQYALPLLMVCLAYFHISIKLRRRMACRSATVTVNTSEIMLQRRRVEEQRASRTNTLIISIVIIFATVWFPLNIYITIVTFNTSLDRTEYFAFCHMFGMFSACANPILYGVLNETFRKEFTQILCFDKISKALNKGAMGKARQERADAKSHRHRGMGHSETSYLTNQNGEKIHREKQAFLNRDSSDTNNNPDLKTHSTYVTDGKMNSTDADTTNSHLKVIPTLSNPEEDPGSRNQLSVHWSPMSQKHSPNRRGSSSLNDFKLIDDIPYFEIEMTSPSKKLVQMAENTGLLEVDEQSENKAQNQTETGEHIGQFNVVDRNLHLPNGHQQVRIDSELPSYEEATGSTELDTSEVQLNDDRFRLLDNIPRFHRISENLDGKEKTKLGQRSMSTEPPDSSRVSTTTAPKNMSLKRVHRIKSTSIPNTCGISEHSHLTTRTPVTDEYCLNGETFNL